LPRRHAGSRRPSTAFLNIALQIAHNGAWQSGWKLVGAPATAAVAA